MAVRCHYPVFLHTEFAISEINWLIDWLFNKFVLIAVQWGWCGTDGNRRRCRILRSGTSNCPIPHPELRRSTQVCQLPLCEVRVESYGRRLWWRRRDVITECFAVWPTSDSRQRGHSVANRTAVINACVTAACVRHYMYITTRYLCYLCVLSLGCSC